ncbi:unnamed protein product [Prunus armeniaca]|uniref:Uncharacterized protein n=1 Tax=Prunus armeniaca TaxID=36596 RepID=A0A6J5WLV3_PRUAR|nr:unnamed protein product [Prunus armeniaca]CAB4300612.1 unnamed protein product [Prunus armeniaca]
MECPCSCGVKNNFTQKFTPKETPTSVPAARSILSRPDLTISQCPLLQLLALDLEFEGFRVYDITDLCGGNTWEENLLLWVVLIFNSKEREADMIFQVFVVE